MNSANVVISGPSDSTALSFLSADSIDFTDFIDFIESASFLSVAGLAAANALSKNLVKNYIEFCNLS